MLPICLQLSTDVKKLLLNYHVLVRGLRYENPTIGDFLYEIKEIIFPPRGRPARQPVYEKIDGATCNLEEFFSQNHWRYLWKLNQYCNGYLHHPIPTWNGKKTVVLPEQFYDDMAVDIAVQCGVVSDRASFVMKHEHSDSGGSSP